MHWLDYLASGFSVEHIPGGQFGCAQRLVLSGGQHFGNDVPLSFVVSKGQGGPAVLRVWMLSSTIRAVRVKGICALWLLL